MIFAAGFGTRMAPLTDDRPKPLIEVGGKTLLEHALAPAREAKLAPIVVNAHYKSQQIVQALEEEDVEVAVEEPRILETGGGLRAALPSLSADHVFTMNSDAVWKGPNPYEALRTSFDDKYQAQLLCVPLENAIGRADKGDFTIAKNGSASRGPGYVYTGAQIISTAAVAAHREDVFSFNVLWDEMLERGTLGFVIYPGSWCDVGRPSSIRMAERMLNVPAER